MNKKLLLVSGALAVSVFFTACGSAPAPEKQAEPDFRCKQDGQLAPEWTCTPYIEGGIAALGTAQANAGGDYGFQMEEAMSNGRTALARQIASKVGTMIKNWKRATGSGADQTFEKNVETVSKQTANQTLNGSRAIKTWKSNENTLYVLVGLTDNQPILQAAKKAAQTSFQNDEALWQQFQSKKAMDELDAELSKSN